MPERALVPWLPVLVPWLLVINVATAVVYAWDKVSARRGARRVPERTLFLLNLLGGFAGAWVVFLVLRHKTRHRSFWVVQSIATVLWVVVIVAVLVR